MLAGVDDLSVFAKFEQYEAENPAPRKEIDGRTIYMSRPMPLTKGYPSLSDLSEARFGNHENTDLIMPDVYRAPEVVLDMPWSYPVDIWALGMVVSHPVIVLLNFMLAKCYTFPVESISLPWEIDMGFV